MGFMTEKNEPLKNKPKPLDLEGIRKCYEEFEEPLYEIELTKDEWKRMWEEIKSRIKSACGFYLKFRNDPSVFFALYPQYYDDFEEKCGSLSDNLEDTECFNEWLFKLAFRRR